MVNMHMVTIPISLGQLKGDFLADFETSLVPHDGRQEAVIYRFIYLVLHLNIPGRGAFRILIREVS